MLCEINLWRTGSTTLRCKNKALIHLGLCLFHLNKILKSQGYITLSTKGHNCTCKKGNY